ncbi:FAD/NAD(P)-binding protein [Kocuria sp.]|uniref:FAD/NAD(P)-binding protein n=1 Tax=Kocuria sp. TaxID=1871328 RepID=UPI0026E04B95|nr:FAD/NAD(P)-binding protein [Kocuria sp.]MDO5618533.1 FAD/NAD(P)-binding protein [Kocuria sp.]
MSESHYVLAIVGAGPSAVYSMERLAALASAGRLTKPLLIHVFDKGGNFGDGEVHSARQSQVSFLNRIAGQVSFAADETIKGANPLLEPEYRLNLAQWCGQRYAETHDQRYSVGAADWPKRYVHGEALRHHFYAYVGLLRKAGVKVVLHPLEVVDIDTSSARIELLCGDSSSVGDVDQVLLVTGHSWNDPQLDKRRHGKAEHAKRAGVEYIGSAYPLERGLTVEAAPAGSVVACEGMGLTAIDIVLYLTEGRGGTFITEGSEVKYVPSGDEPSRIIPFSGSGLFTFARPDNHKQVDLALYEHRGVFLTKQAVDIIRAHRGEPGREGTQVDFERDIFPLVLLEMALLHATTLFGGDTRGYLRQTVEESVSAFLSASIAQAPASAEIAQKQLQEEIARIAALIDQRLDGTISLEECRVQANGWDFGLAAASFVHCVWGKAARAPVGTVVAAEQPRRYLTSESPFGLAPRALESPFDWDRTIRPIPGSACDTPERYRAAMLEFFGQDDTAAARGNLAHPAKAAADGVWRDLRDVLAHAVDRGGLTPSSHRRFLEVYMRHHNRLANGAAREVMAKIRAVAECGLLDVGVGPGGSVRLDDKGYMISGPLTGYEGHAGVLVDATVHAFDPRLDTAVLYRNLLNRGVVRLWENVGGEGLSEIFVPGGLDLDESFSPRGASGKVDSRITVLGPPSEGVVFFQLGALRPEQNHHVMQDILTWVAKLDAEGLLTASDTAVPR